MERDLKQEIFEYLQAVPKGKVVTYAQIGDYLGNRFLARYVGNVLHQNPDGEKYPCYKVVNAKGELTKAFVFGGIDVQKARLEAEGIEVADGRVDLRKYLWKEQTKWK